MISTRLFAVLLCVSFFLFGFATNQKVIAHENSLSPHILVVFGATGDLTKRKLAPALIQLSQQGELPKQFMCIGVGRKSIDQSQFLLQTFHIDKNFDGNLIHQILYLQGEFEDAQTYKDLFRTIQEIKTKWGMNPTVIFYLACSQSKFGVITKHLYENHLLGNKNIKVLMEKPFGMNLTSAIQLKEELEKYLDKNQMHFVDHYLGKKIVRNLLEFRFSNPNFHFESLWNRNYIENITITISEDLGIENRGAFWEETGLLRDMIQSHTLQLISLVTMEKPHSFIESDIRKEKIRLLQSIRSLSGEEIEHSIVRGQYGEGIVHGQKVKAYRQEIGVSPESTVETFVAAKLFIDNERWYGVPIFIKVGKRLTKKYANIVIHFKGDHDNLGNKLIFRIQPEEEIVYQAKDNDNLYKIFFYPSDQNVLIKEAYGQLFFDLMHGKSSSFVSYEEHVNAWKLLTPILDDWEKNSAHDLLNYAAGSEGPDLSSLFKKNELQEVINK